MTSSAIGEFGQLFYIITGFLLMTIETPTHVHHLGVLSNGHLGHITMAIFAVHTRCNAAIIDWPP